jgi:hypothetical protein
MYKDGHIGNPVHLHNKKGEETDGGTWNR